MIFCVEDDDAIRGLMLYALNAAGFAAKGFADSTGLFGALETELPRLILLDIMLPGEDGISILKRLRGQTATAGLPVIMAMAKGTEYDKVTGLDLGADDYLTKPFGMMEMVSRVRAVLRRCTPEQGAKQISAGGVTVSLEERTVTAGGETDLYAIAAEAVSALQSRADAKHVHMELSGESTAICGVRGFLYEMIYNLCDNAIKYNVEDGSVGVSVSRKAQGPVLTVRDTGIGIPREYQSRIFERFFRVDKSRSKASGGTGLGLSIVKHIAQYHDASVKLRSEPGAGTLVSVIFPDTGGPPSSP